ncbi:MAG: ParB/RepB/Spo0J family partition protein [Clostridia bacterium]|nr:ParB/RepB/Spo0J family partition protein [Clostridia bacterium]
MAVKKPQRGGLGRGLGALLGDDVVAAAAEEEKKTDEIMNLPVRLVDPNLDQPRRAFDEAALTELAQSIATVGVIQPIIVCKNGERYTIIAGERRYRAARMAGLEEIPAIVRDWEKQARLEAALIENLQRADLNPIEEAAGVKQLMEETGLTQEKAAERLGKSRPAVANLLRLLTLPENVIGMLRDGRLSAGHGRALVTVDKSKQEKLAQLCAAQGWSVRQFEKICQAANQPAEEEKPVKPRKDPQLKELETLARETLGLRAKLDGDLNSGKIVLNYYSQDDLQRVWDALAKLK